MSRAIPKTYTIHRENGGHIEVMGPFEFHIDQWNNRFGKFVDFEDTVAKAEIHEEIVTMNFRGKNIWDGGETKYINTWYEFQA